MSNELDIVNDQIKNIAQLAHASDDASQDQYKALQGDLVRLCNQKDELVSQGLKPTRGAVARGPPQPALATQSAGTAPSSWMEYAKLPTSDQFDQSIDGKVWEMALPEFQQLKLTTTQVAGIARILEQSSREALRLRVQARDVVKAQTEARMAGQYGSRWPEVHANANRYIESKKRHHRDVRVGDLILNDGTRVGDHPHYVSMLCDLAESQR